MVDWVLWEQVGLSIDTAGGVLFLILGIAVALLKLQNRQQKWFIAFAISFGLFYTFNNLRALVEDWNVPLQLPDFISRVVTMVCSIGLGYSLVGGRTARRAWPAAILAAVVFALHLAALILIQVNSGLRTNDWGEIAYALSYGGLTWLVLVQAWVTPEKRSGTIAFAMVPFMATNAGLWAIIRAIYRRPDSIALNGEVAGTWISWLWASSFLVMAASMLAVWAWHLLTKEKVDLWPRRIILSTAGFTLLGTLWAVFTHEGAAPNNLGILGLTRMFGVATLAFGIARRQTLDLDIKVKFGLSRSMVAAIFITSFFVVSEMVSGLLSERIGTIAGVLTTGALVFALAPLQQFGERIADRALPDVKPLDERTLKERQNIYRDMLRSAWEDGVISQKEAKMLRVAQERLSLTPEQASKVEKAFH